MIKSMNIAVKVKLNVHDLNNEAVAGNVTDIRIMEFLDENNEKKEAPAVSGRMLKHWHYEAMRNLIINGQYGDIQLCEGCKIDEPIRPGVIQNNTLSQNSGISENKVVQNCAICDIHGYLIASGNVSFRRTSRVMFSWLMPVLNSNYTSKQIIHTRVSQQNQESEGSREIATQMIFYKSYASGLYAFVSSLDIDRIGFVETIIGNTESNVNNSNNKKNVIDQDNKKKRVKVAVESYLYMISGKIGASLSHSIPHMDIIEVLVCYSEKGPLPFPVSPMYSDYIEKTIGIMPEATELLYWGTASPSHVIKKKNTIKEIFDELLKKIEE